jgi:hypothetical protein
MTVRMRRLVAAGWAMLPAIAITIVLPFVVEGAKRW